jgi:hypothetical protein
MFFETGYKVFGGKIFGPTSKMEVTVSLEIIVPSILAPDLVTHVSVLCSLLGSFIKISYAFRMGKQWNTPLPNCLLLVCALFEERIEYWTFNAEEYYLKTLQADYILKVKWVIISHCSCCLCLQICVSSYSSYA